MFITKDWATVANALICPKCNKMRRVKIRFYESYASYFGVGRCKGMRKKWKHMAECGYEFNFGE